MEKEFGTSNWSCSSSDFLPVDNLYWIFFGLRVGKIIVTNVSNYIKDYFNL